MTVDDALLDRRLSALETRVRRYVGKAKEGEEQRPQQGNDIDAIAQQLTERLDQQHRAFSAQLETQKQEFLGNLQQQQETNQLLQDHLRALSLARSDENGGGFGMFAMAAAFVTGAVTAVSLYQRVQRRRLL